MINTYAKAYTEVLEILKCLPDEELNNIPKEEIEFYEKNKDQNYIYKYNPLKSLKEQNISREANAILVTIFRDFFATDNQKEKLNKILIKNEEIYNEKLKEKYNIDNVFKTKNKDVEQKENIAIIEYKESVFKRVIKKIKDILHIK